MDQNIREKALKFAAKAVVSAAFLAACGGADDPNDDISDDELATKSPACQKALPKLKTAFPSGDKQWYSHTGPSPSLKGDHAVVTCCASTASSIEKFRSLGCCAADLSLASKTEQGKIGMACTPWGPPVPPAANWLPSERLAA